MRSQFVFISLLSLTISLLSCVSCRTHVNKPPKADEPWPNPHSGVFVSGNDTLWFNGDGVSISWHFAEGLDSLGLVGQGSYAFLFDGALWRYDAAERFDIISDDHQISFGLGVPGSCNDSVIYLRRFDLPGRESVDEVFISTKL